MMMILNSTRIKIALDPSFTGMGVFALTDAEIPPTFPKITPNGKMGFAKLKASTRVSGGFEGILYACVEMSEKLRQLIHGCEVTVCVSETPPPFGTFAAGLYALDTYLLSQDYLGPRRYLLPPSAINSFFSVRSPKKRFITDVVTRALGDQAVRLNHDEASAYLLMRLWSLRMKKIVNRPTMYFYDGNNPPKKIGEINDKESRQKARKKSL